MRQLMTGIAYLGSQHAYSLTTTEPFMPLTVLVTSTGRICRYVISSLLSLPNCPIIRVLARAHVDVEKAFPQALRSHPHSIVTIDRFDGRTLEAAFKGAAVVFHTGPLIDPQEEATSIAMIDAARAAGVGHFVLCSVLHPFRTKLESHKTKIAIEGYLAESRLNYTVLQPAHYMQNVDLSVAVRSGVIPLGFSAYVEHSFIDMTDLAHIARMIILDPKKHNQARYELVSQSITYHEVARIIAKVAARDIQCEVLSPKAFVEHMMGSPYVRSEHSEDAIMRMMVYYDRWGLVGNSNVLKWLLGREPITWEEYARRELRR
ncbi:hypothetical protein M422DRAFT_37663 [Sphaerobolus stellatus SS14]|uniref:NmrA-like domain-containing protein n=1 Tax=Sphaerobolus stellatus (strain SS14) TaxID=990650 RepID=A0A0C9UQI1_SPHS4|nr:hypothetical protein M422DRAFT_37663 [Sphaerobolus stellatus SS14]